MVEKNSFRMAESVIKQHICTSSSSTPANPQPPDLVCSELAVGWLPTQTVPTAELRIISWNKLKLGNCVDFNCAYFKSAIAINLTINRQKDRSKQWDERRYKSGKRRSREEWKHTEGLTERMMKGGEERQWHPWGRYLQPDHQLTTPITIDQAIKCAFLPNGPLTDNDCTYWWLLEHHAGPKSEKFTVCQLFRHTRSGTKQMSALSTYIRLIKRNPVISSCKTNALCSGVGMFTLLSFFLCWISTECDH